MNAVEINVLKELMGKSYVEKVAPAVLVTNRGRQSQVIMSLFKNGLVQFIGREDSRDVFATATCNLDKFIKAGWKHL